MVIVLLEEEWLWQQQVKGQRSAHNSANIQEANRLMHSYQSMQMKMQNNLLELLS